MPTDSGVTIVIPNWNHEILLPRSILSALKAVAILRGRGTAAEVLVLDDFSRDGSPAMLRGLEALYYEQGLRVVAFGENGGLVANRNYALLNANYRYITFMDADNELVPENLPLMVETLEQTGAAAAYGNLLVRSPSADHAHNATSNESIQPKIFKDNYVDAFSILDRQQVLDAGGYEATCTTWEDYELWLHLASNGRQIVFVPVVFGYYYVLPGSMVEDTLKAGSVRNRVTRIFDQVGVRKFLDLATERLRYHPRIGYL